MPYDPVHIYNDLRRWLEADALEFKGKSRSARQRARRRYMRLANRLVADVMHSDLGVEIGRRFVSLGRRDAD